MAVMTHAPIPHLTLPVAAHYTALGEPTQTNFDLHREDADNALTDREYIAAMVEAAHTAGIAVPTSNDVALCECFTNGCGCDLIFDAALPGVHVVAPAKNGNLNRLQCPDCAHDHPRTDNA